MKNSTTFLLIFSGVILMLSFIEVIGFWGLVGLGLVLIVIYTGMSAREGKIERKEKKNKISDELKSLENFTPSKTIISPWGLIAIDDDTKQIAVKENEGVIFKFSYSDIMGCEIIEDGETTYRKSSTVGRAIVGGIIAGGAGAIIGGLSGKEKENKEIKNLDFKIVFKDTNKPSFKIRFFDAWEETSNTQESIKLSDFAYGPIFQKSLDKLQNWKDTIEIIIDRIDSERKENSDNSVSITKENSDNSVSIADELTKLNDLKEKGILTEEEFTQQKKKILEQ